MARKRLTPAKPEFLSESAPRPEAATHRPPRLSGPPIAQVAGEAAAVDALQTLSEDVARARAEGMMILRIPLDEIAEDYLTRDRMVVEADDMRSLEKSIFDHGQRTPIEVAAIDGSKPYGLISGWRRHYALQELKRKTGDAAFDTVLAVIRQPKDASDAYVAMVEENEIRVGLSYYERAMVVVETVKSGVFETEKQALQTLFSSASRAKRSRIKAFMDICRELGDVLIFPTAIPERFGLELVYAMRNDRHLADLIRVSIAREKTFEDEAAEQAVLKHCLKPHKSPIDTPPAPKVPHAEHLSQILHTGLKVELKGSRIILSGAPVSEELYVRVCNVLSETVKQGD